MFRRIRIRIGKIPAEVRNLFIFLGILLLLTGLALFFVLRPYRASTDRWPDAYPIVGGEHQEFWDLKWEALTGQINDNRPDGSAELTLLRGEPGPSSMQVMLTENGETWLIVLDILPRNAADSSIWNRYPDVEQWLGNVEEVTLTLDYSQESLEKRIQYARVLINLFNPGAEDYVVKELDLRTQKEDGFVRVLVGNTVYTKMAQRLIIEPFTAS